MWHVAQDPISDNALSQIYLYWRQSREDTQTTAECSSISMSMAHSTGMTGCLSRVVTGRSMDGRRRRCGREREGERHASEHQAKRRTRCDLTLNLELEDGPSGGRSRAGRIKISRIGLVILSLCWLPKSPIDGIRGIVRFHGVMDAILVCCNGDMAFALYLS